ncbi:MAG TPA: type II secretion system F family protein [Desulfomonilia bacterium]|nr:type II secretion system F family protein [Desulfomonilia bacterium]
MDICYNALRKDGTTITAKGSFDGIRELMDTLTSQELILVSYHEQKFPVLETIKTLLQPGVKRIEIAEFCETLASMIGSGLPLLDSMDSIKETIKVKRLRHAIEEVIKEIAQGESLSGAFSRHQDVFPEMLIFFCSIGEETGTIQNALNNTASYLKRVDGIISQVKRALIYPCFVMCAMIAVIIFWMFYVLPRLAATFKEINVQLPDITVSLVNFVKFSKHYWYLFPMAIGCIIALFVILSRIPRIRMLLSRLAFHLPVVGDLLKCSTLTLVFSTMSLMLQSGVTLTRSLDILEKIFHNDLVRSVIMRIREETNMGNSLLDAFRRTDFFDAVTLKMVSVGEKTGTLDQRLKYLADTYEIKTSRFVEVMGKMIEPIAIVMTGGIFVFIVISLIGPVYDLMSKLGGG